MKPDDPYGWHWLRGPAFVRLQSPFDVRECTLRLLRKVHCEGLAEPSDEVVGAVSVGSATLRRVHRHIPFSRAVDAAATVEVSMSSAGDGATLDCLCSIGGPTLVSIAYPFLIASGVGAYLFVGRGLANPFAWGAIVLIVAYGAIFARSLKSQAAEDVRFILAFLTHLLVVPLATVDER